MKKLLFSLSLLASLATFAGESSVDASAQVFGVMPISSTASKVIVCVPWRASSTTDSAIKVTDLIRTAELTENDWIRVWDQTANSGAGAFKVWRVDSNKNWVPVDTVTGLSTVTATGDETLARGDAVVLYRSAAATSPIFYVQGQYLALGSSETTTVAEGDSTIPAYTLIAPPMTAAVNLNSSGIAWASAGSIAEKDRLVYGQSGSLGKEYRYKNGKWGYYKSSGGKTTFVVPDAIPAGIGFWYVSKGGNPTIQWTTSK